MRTSAAKAHVQSAEAHRRRRFRAQQKWQERKLPKWLWWTIWDDFEGVFAKDPFKYIGIVVGLLLFFSSGQNPYLNKGVGVYLFLTGALMLWVLWKGTRGPFFSKVHALNFVNIGSGLWLFFLNGLIELNKVIGIYLLVIGVTFILFWPVYFIVWHIYFNKYEDEDYFTRGELEDMGKLPPS